MNEASHSTSQGAHPIDEKVRSLMDRRLETARALADRAATLTAAKEQLAEALRGYSDAFKDAQKAGWDEKELEHLGLETPERPPRRRATRKRSGDQASTDNGDTAQE